MEHSWVGNIMLLAAMRLLTPNQPWHKTRIVWAGDYADKGAHVSKRLQAAYEKWVRKYHPDWVEKYPDSIVPNVYDLGMDKLQDVTVKGKDKKVKAPKWSFVETHPAPLTKEEAKRFHFIVNHTKKQFVNINTVPNIKGWRVHPLSLLTSSGNGRGGGDYHEDGNSFVGSWAGDVISVEEAAPKGFAKIKPDFKEDW